MVDPLRRRFPHAMISAITKPHAADLWNGLIDPQRLILAPQLVSDRRRERANWRSMAALARQLRARQFDLVIDLMGNRYSAAFTFLLRPRLGIGFDGQELGWLYSLRVRAELPGDHLSQRPLRVIAPLIQLASLAVQTPLTQRSGSVSDGANQHTTGERLSHEDALRQTTRQWHPATLEPDPCESRFPAPPLSTVDPSKLLAEVGLSGKRYQVIAPFAGWREKEWPSENFARLAAVLAKRGFVVVIVGTASEQARCQQLAAGVATDPAAPRTVAFTGRPLGELVALLSRASGAAANDSAVAHIAAAFGLPTAAIFTASTDPTKFAPLGPKARVFPQDCSIDEVMAHLARD